ncbi:MAG: hypothetical protein ACLVJK_08215 [Alistipes putredinis]
MKKHKFKILTFVAVAAALAGTGCFKSIGYETFTVLRPWAQEVPSRPHPRGRYTGLCLRRGHNQKMGVSHALCGDAVAGIITSRRTGEKLRPIAQGEPYEIDGNENWLAMQLNGPRFLILAVDQSRSGFTDSPSRPSTGESSPDAERNLLPKKADVS